MLPAKGIVQLSVPRSYLGQLLISPQHLMPMAQSQCMPVTVTLDFMVTESTPKPDHLCYKHEATQDARWSVDGFAPAHIYILLTGK